MEALVIGRHRVWWVFKDDFDGKLMEAMIECHIMPLSAKLGSVKELWKNYLGWIVGCQ